MTDFSQIAKEAELKKNAPSSVSVSKNFNYVKANYVSIVDIDTPFKSMVFYYFKWSFAVIPTGYPVQSQHTVLFEIINCRVQFFSIFFDFDLYFVMFLIFPLKFRIFSLNSISLLK